MKCIKLPQRLQTIADLISDGASVVDIGTNHGLLPIYLAQKGKTKKIIATDISSASLNAARCAVCQLEVKSEIITDAIKFRVTPGLDGITAKDVDTIIIAGMGAETIVEILKKAPWIKEQKTKLILQPQSKIYILFRFLYNEGHEIRKIKYIQDRGKRYVVILV